MPEFLDFSGLFKIAVGRCGISVNDFWDMTPHEIFLLIDEYQAQQIERQQEILTLAWTISSLSRAKKIPSLSKLLKEISGDKKKMKPKPSTDELIAEAKAKNLKGPWQ